MTAQFGVWSFDGRGAGDAFQDAVRCSLTSFDWRRTQQFEEPGIFICSVLPTDVLLSHCELATLNRTPSGAVVTWDGRLDNRDDLARELNISNRAHVTDSAFAAAAFDRWRKDSFKRLVGDWALSVWEPAGRTLLLAKDFLGTRPLYYSFDEAGIVWSSALEPLIELSRNRLSLDEEYLAGWITFFPAIHLTPYSAIHSVPPGSYVTFGRSGRSVRKYWDFDPAKRIRYRTDAEYEHHFVGLFRESVKRRLRSDAPVLAELSGGIDSSSIVCIADSLIEHGDVTSSLNTVSYYDDSEPNWNERQYFPRIEQKRGRRGHHIAVNWDATGQHFTPSTVLPMPSSLALQNDPAWQVSSLMKENGYRVLLSGVGGDEMLGGIPNPTPELADLAARARFVALLRRSLAWALADRTPLFQVLWHTASSFVPFQTTGISSRAVTPSWLNPHFAERQRRALAGYPSRFSIGPSLPSFQENLNTFELLRRQISSAPENQPHFDECFPLLDRDLLEFLFAIPREQLLRPGHRRSLMRRALSGIVPDEILNRRRKAFVTHGPRAGIALAYRELTQESSEMRVSALGIVNPEELARTLEAVRTGQPANIVSLLRIFGIERWLRQFPESCLPLLENSPVAMRPSPVAGSCPQEFSCNQLNVRKKRRNNHEVRKT